MKNLIDKKYWIWFSLIPKLGVKRKQKLLDIYKNPEAIYYLDEKKLHEIEGFEECIIKEIKSENTRKIVKKHIEYMEKNNIDIINIEDSEYPQILKEIYDPPISLYCRGNKNALKNKSIGVVGCRDATQYGKSASKYFAYNLTKQNVNIVSGLAKGVDSYAHIGSICAQLENNSLQQNQTCGKTIAVLGNGLDDLYPKDNLYIAKKIIECGGAIVSEYPLGTKPDKMNFPARNRIISGLSSGILVVEAKEKSGTLITVDFALEQGRDVFVVPGNINSLNSVGTNALVKQGARLVTNYTEIFL